MSLLATLAPGPLHAQQAPAAFAGFGPLQPAGLRGAVDVAEGLSVTVLSRVGTLMSDARFVPMFPRGLGAFPGPDGSTILLSAHDIPPGTPSRSGPFGMQSNLMLNGRDTTNVYDRGPTGDKPSYASVTASVVDRRGMVVLRNWLSISGLMRASRGTALSSGIWLVGEAETRWPDDRYARPHGYVFQLEPIEGAQKPVSLPSLGRFAHGAIAEDPSTGTIYLTEDRTDGLFYRFVPTSRGDLSGGTLSALVLGSAHPDGARNVSWVEVDASESGADDLRARGAARGATPVPGAGGLLWTGDGLMICAELEPGNPLWSLRPADGSITPFALPSQAFDSVSDVAIAPWGALLVSGKGADGHAVLAAVTPEGITYPMLRSARPDGRIGRPVAAPDGRTLFVNLLDDGQLLAIRGGWPF